MNDIWQILITTLGGYTIILGGLFWWLGKRMLQSHLAKEKGNIQKSVNSENAKLLAEHQKELEELKAKFTTEESIRHMLTGSISNFQSKVFEKRLAYVGDLWVSFCNVKNLIPPELVFLDILTESEYIKWVKIKENPEIPTMEKIAQQNAKIIGDIEKVRPFVGEYLWSMYFAYRAFSMRLAISPNLENKKETPIYWKKDNGLIKILTTVLTNDEILTFKGHDIGAIRYVQTLMESKFIEHVEKIFSGDISIQKDIEQARNIMLSVQQEMSKKA